MGIQINGNTNNINAGIGSLSIEDINELDIVGVATAANFKTGVSNLHNVGLTLSGGQIDVGSNIKIGTAGVITATSFVGSGANLTGIAADKIYEGNTEAEVVDTGSDGHFKVTTEGSERLRIHSDGKIGIGLAGGTPDGLLEVYNSSTAGNTVLKVHNDKNGDAANLTLEGKRTSDNDTAQVLFKNNNYSVAGIFANAGGSGNHDGGYLKFLTSQVGSGNVVTEKVRITSGGHVNIGTSELDQTVSGRFLNVYGGQIRVRQTSSGNTLEVFGHSTSGQSYGLLVNAGTTSADYAAHFRNSGGSTIAMIRGDRKVGIGTDSPSFFTHIQGDGVTGDVLKITARGSGQMVNIQNHSNVASIVRFSNYLGNAFWDAQYNTDNSFGLDYGDSEKFRITSAGIVKITGNSSGQLNLRRSTSTDQEAIFYYGSSSLEIETREATSIFLKTNKQPRVKIQADGNVGIARTINNQQTSSTNSIYNLSINRESNPHTYDGLNRSLNVDNKYTVQTFRSTNTNRNSTVGWMDVAHFRAWDMNARVIIQAGGTFTGDQINIDVQSSYNSALSNGRAGPVLEVKRTEGHTGGRFTQVRIGCHNSNRQPILQVYFNGGATHNSAGSVTVTVHDYGSNYGSGAYRGEAKFASATTLNEIWESLDIDESGCDYFNTSTTPAFSAYKADNANQIGSGTYAFNSQTLDRGGDNYNTSNGRFTAPCDGVYYFIATLQMYGGSATVHARFQKNGTDVYNNGTNTPYYDEKHSSHANLSPFCLVELSKDDYVECVRNGNTRGMQSAVAGFLVR